MGKYLHFSFHHHPDVTGTVIGSGYHFLPDDSSSTLSPIGSPNINTTDADTCSRIIYPVSM